MEVSIFGSKKNKTKKQRVLHLCFVQQEYGYYSDVYTECFRCFVILWNKTTHTQTFNPQYIFEKGDRKATALYEIGTGRMVPEDS